MNQKEDKSLVRELGLPECVTITGGAVIGVGLFTVGSSQVGIAGCSIIIASITSPGVIPQSRDIFCRWESVCALTNKVTLRRFRLSLYIRQHFLSKSSLCIRDSRPAVSFRYASQDELRVLRKTF